MTGPIRGNVSFDAYKFGPKTSTIPEDLLRIKVRKKPPDNASGPQKNRAARPVTGTCEGGTTCVKELEANAFLAAPFPAALPVGWYLAPQGIKEARGGNG